METKKYKEILENEVKKLETELSTVGRKNPDQAGDWEATESEDVDTADDLDVADSLEVYENNRGILNALETQLASVKKALSKIEDGSFGKCEVCGETIEDDRLDVNPSANTCKKHM